MNLFSFYIVIFLYLFKINSFWVIIFMEGIYEIQRNTTNPNWSSNIKKL